MALVSSEVMRETELPQFICGVRSGTRTAADFTITVGFAPKKVRVINLTDRVEAVYWVNSNLTATYGLLTVADGTRTFADVGISVSNRSFTVDVSVAGLEADNDEVLWEVWG